MIGVEMGIEDRDWYRDEQRKRLENIDYFKRKSQPTNWLVIILFWTVLLYGLFQLSKRFELFHLGSTFAGIPGLAEADSKPLPRTPAARPITEAERPQPRPTQVAPVTTQIYQESIAPNNPQGSATIYRCKAYSGGVFWSSAYCGTQQALVDRIATVPSGMSFEQQIQIAEGQRLEAMALYNQQPSAAVQRSSRCVALKREREIIESRYTNWQWQPLEVINPDQTRMKGLRAEQARLACPTQ